MKTSLKTAAMSVFLAATGLGTAGCEKKPAPESYAIVQLPDGETGALSACGDKEIQKKLEQFGKKDMDLTVEYENSGRTVRDKRSGEEYPVICVKKIEVPGTISL